MAKTIDFIAILRLSQGEKNMYRDFLETKIVFRGIILQYNGNQKIPFSFYYNRKICLNWLHKLPKLQKYHEKWALCLFIVTSYKAR